MEENIFKGAKFGDKFVTRNGDCVLYIYTTIDNYTLVATKRGTVYRVLCNGIWDIYDLEENKIDVVSRWVEPIDEDKLEKLVENVCSDAICSYSKSEAIEQAELYFKAGYHKAMGE